MLNSGSFYEYAFSLALRRALVGIAKWCPSGRQRLWLLLILVSASTSFSGQHIFLRFGLKWRNESFLWERLCWHRLFLSEAFYYCILLQFRYFLHLPSTFDGYQSDFPKTNLAAILLKNLAPLYLQTITSTSGAFNAFVTGRLSEALQTLCLFHSPICSSLWSKQTSARVPHSCAFFAV